MNGDKRLSETSEERAVRTGKRPYQKPAFVREQVFETMALACGKIDNTGGCKFVKKNS